MIKIGYDAKRYYHNKTGLGNYSRTLISAIKQQYADVEFILYDEKPWNRTFQLGHKVKADSCQLFHGLSNEIPRDIVSSGMPSIVTIHDVAWRTFPKMYSIFDRIIYDEKYGWSAKHATKVLCISESTKHDIIRFYGIPEDRIAVIYQPVAKHFYTPMPQDWADNLCYKTLPFLKNRQYVLTVGAINSRKNLLGMVRAYEKIIKLMPDDKRPLFVVVGNGGWYRHKVMTYIKEHNLANYVHIESNIHDNDTLQALYANALCFMYPSFYEGFGLPVVEAALQRCPVITSNISSLPEAAGPDALLVNPTSIEEITDALYFLISNETKRIEIGNSVYKYSYNKFRPDILISQLHDLYKSLL